MKTITSIILLFAVVILTSCEGEQGRPGYDGVDGVDGIDGEIGSVFQTTGTFSSANDYTLYYAFPNEIYDGDVVLVYILWNQEESTTGDLLNVWRLLPQTRILDEGILQYNYDYTFADVQIFLDGAIDFTTLAPGDVEDQTFRIAVLPAALVTNKSIDTSDLNSLMKSLEINTNSIEKINPVK